MPLSERIQWGLVALIGLALIIKSWRKRPWKKKRCDSK
jgi:hypothetical protein